MYGHEKMEVWKLTASLIIQPTSDTEIVHRFDDDSNKIEKRGTLDTLNEKASGVPVI